jgi:hypothetical protein
MAAPHGANPSPFYLKKVPAKRPGPSSGGSNETGGPHENTHDHSANGTASCHVHVFRGRANVLRSLEVKILNLIYTLHFEVIENDDKTWRIRIGTALSEPFATRDDAIKAIYSLSMQGWPEDLPSEQ